MFYGSGFKAVQNLGLKQELFFVVTHRSGPLSPPFFSVSKSEIGFFTHILSGGPGPSPPPPPPTPAPSFVTIVRPTPFEVSFENV
jgi:hypothetical protein